MQKIKSVAGKNVREWLNVSNRKCRNVLFLLLFVVVVCGSVYFEFIDKKYRVTNNKESFANVLQPADEFRRVCGVNASQPDIYATDYAKLITSQSRLQSFCGLILNMNDTGIIDVPYLHNNSFGCNSFSNGLFGSSQYKENSKVFFDQIMKTHYQDMSEYRVGYQLQYYMCVHSNYIDAETCQPTNVNESAVAYVCEREMLDIAKYAGVDMDNQFIDLTTYQKIKQNLLDKDSNLGFVMEMCKEMPTAESQLNYELYKSDLFASYSQKISPKCIFNINKAFKESRDTQDIITALFHYLSQAFIQPLGSIILEIDVNWKQLLIQLSITIVFTLIFQVLMNVISKFIVIVTIIGLEAGLGFLAYLVFNKANNVRTIESEQQEKYIEQPFLYLAFGLIVLCMLMSIFLACGLWNAAKVLEKSLLVVKKMIAKVFPVLVIPLIMIAVSIGVIIYYGYVIILHSAGSSFNASRIVWTLLYYEDG